MSFIHRFCACSRRSSSSCSLFCSRRSCASLAFHLRHAETLARAATSADARLAECRATLAGNFAKTGRMRDDCATMQRAKQEFQSIHEASQEARRRSDASRRVAASCKAFVDQLPDAAGIDVCKPPQPNGVDLGECRSRITAIRAKITKLHSAPTPSDRARVEMFVDEVRRPAREQIEQLLSRWPHFTTVESLRMGNDHTAIAALLTVMAPRDAMVDWLCAQIDARADVTAPEKLAALESELVALQQLEAMFVGRAIESGATTTSCTTLDGAGDHPGRVLSGVGVSSGVDGFPEARQVRRVSR